MKQLSLTLRKAVVLIFSLMLMPQWGWAMDARMGKVKITYDYTYEGKKGMYIEVFDINVSGMKGQKVHFGANLAQDGKWLPDMWVATTAQDVNFEHTVWESVWFFYSYEKLEKVVDFSKKVQLAVFVVNTANIDDNINKNEFITIPYKKKDNTAVDDECMKKCLMNNAMRAVSEDEIVRGCKAECSK